jgi:hypothetical protein
MRFEVGHSRTALAARNVSLVLVAVTIAVVAIGAAFFSQCSSPANPGTHSSSSSLGSSSVSSSSSFIQSTVQSSSVSSNSGLNQSAAPYPLVWGPNPTRDCDPGIFCLDVTLGFAGQTATNNTASSATTIIQGNATTIINSSTTTIINGSSTDWIYPNTATSYYVAVSAFVQDAATGQNATRPDGDGPLVQSGCYIEPTGLTPCTIYAPFGLAVPSGDPYKVTLFVTMGETPCPLQKAGLPCTSQLLAPPTTFTIPASEDLAPPIPGLVPGDYLSVSSNNS